MRQKYFKKELIYVDYECTDQKDFFRTISNNSIVKNYIKEGFLEAITEREKNFPTGLDFGKYKIAIPHTNPEYIEKEGIVFIHPKEKIVFRDMGLDSIDLEVDFILLLLVKNSGGQIQLLENIMDMFSNEDLLDQLIKERDKENIYSLLLKN